MKGHITDHERVEDGQHDITALWWTACEVRFARTDVSRGRPWGHDRRIHEAGPRPGLPVMLVRA